MRPCLFTFPAVDQDGIAAAQTLGAAGALTLNGALVDGPETMNGRRIVILPGIQRTVTVFSSADLSAVDFTITGFDLRGNAVTETIAGPDTTPTTNTTTAEFHIITGVTASAAVASAVEIGTGSSGVTNWYTSDLFKNPTNMTVALGITATANVTVQDTPDDANAAAPSLIFDHPTLAAKTSSAESNYAFPPRFVRAKMNSSSGSGAFTFTIIQAG